MGIATPCDNVFRVKLPAGSADIMVNAGLTPTTPYWYFITDKFGRIYAKSITTDGSGSFTLLNADFPMGLFSAYGGSFLLQVKKNLTYAAAQSLLFCAISYDTIQMDFANFPESAIPPSVIDCK